MDIICKNVNKSYRRIDLLIKIFAEFILKKYFYLSESSNIFLREINPVYEQHVKDCIKIAIFCYFWCNKNVSPDSTKKLSEDFFLEGLVFVFL